MKSELKKQHILQQLKDVERMIELNNKTKCILLDELKTVEIELEKSKATTDDENSAASTAASYTTTSKVIPLNYTIAKEDKINSADEDEVAVNEVEDDDEIEEDDEALISIDPAIKITQKSKELLDFLNNRLKTKHVSSTLGDTPRGSWTNWNVTDEKPINWSDLYGNPIDKKKSALYNASDYCKTVNNDYYKVIEPDKADNIKYDKPTVGNFHWESASAKKQENDLVKHPNHYGADGQLQCLEAMLIAFGKEKTKAFCELNAFKYEWRASRKGQEVQDHDKVIRYTEYWKVLNALPGDTDDGSLHDFLNKR